MDHQGRVLAASGQTSASIAVRLKRSAAGIRKRAINLGHRAGRFDESAGAEGEGEMTANVLSRIFTIEIGDTPTLMFEAQNLRETIEAR